MGEGGRDNNVPFVRDYDHTGQSEPDYNGGSSMDEWRADVDRRAREAGVQPQSTGAFIADQLHPVADAAEQVPPVPEQ